MNDAKIMMIQAKSAELKRARADKDKSIRTMSIDGGKEFQTQHALCEKLAGELIEIIDGGPDGGDAVRMLNKYLA